MRKKSLVALAVVVVVGVVSAAYWSGNLPGFGKVVNRVDRLDGGCASRVSQLPLLSSRRVGRTLALGATAQEVASWTPDYLVALSLELDRQYLPLCPSDNAFRFSSELKREYLRRLGHPGPFADSLSLDRMFRVFLATGDDFTALSRQLASSDLTTATKVSQEILSRVQWPTNASAVRKNAIPVLAASPAESAALEQIVARMGSLFFDGRAVTQVRLTEVTPMAAYVPATGTLVFSRVLLNQDSDLHRFIVAHELAHSAIFYARWVLDEDWVENFAPFSKWTFGTDGTWSGPEYASTELRQDGLTEAFKDSPFSLLPDPVLMAPQGSGAESFILARAYREKNPEEDLADSLAAWKLIPERFCHGGVAIAEGKYEWVAAHAFKNSKASPPPLNCPAPN